jgi:hypothetical protein
MKHYIAINHPKSRFSFFLNNKPKLKFHALLYYVPSQTLAFLYYLHVKLFHHVLDVFVYPRICIRGSSVYSSCIRIQVVVNR